MALSGANVHDSKMLEAVVDAVPEVRSGRPGGPRFRPKKVYADKGYDYARCRVTLQKRGIIARIARRGVESSERLGRHRWRVEQTQGWLNRYKPANRLLAHLPETTASVVLEILRASGLKGRMGSGIILPAKPLY